MGGDDERHIPWHELSEACAGKGCPLCSIVAERGKRWMDNLLFEHVSDRPFRAAFREAGGFCPEHNRSLGSSRDGLALAILYRDALSASLSLLSKGKAPSGDCPACVERRRIEGEYMGLLREASGELKEAFESSEGLCLSHYARLLSLRPKPPAWLREFHEKRFAALLERADRFIDLSAYGRQAEFAALSREDQLVWMELLEKARKRPE